MTMTAFTFLASGLVLLASANATPERNDWTVNFYNSPDCSDASLTGSQSGETFYNWSEVGTPSAFVTVTDHRTGPTVDGIYVCSDVKKTSCVYLAGTTGCKESTVGPIKSFLIV